MLILPSELEQIRACSKDESSFQQLIELITAHYVRREEKALRPSDELLERIAKVAKVGGWEIDLQARIPVWTEEMYRIHEVEPGTPITLERTLEFYAPEDRQTILNAIQRASQDGTGWDLEFPFITAKGRHRWVRITCKVDLEDGRPARVYGVFQDITDRKEVENALRASEERLRLVSDNLPKGAVYQVMREPDGRVHFPYFSAGIERILGVLPEEIMANPGLLDCLTLEEDRPLLRKASNISHETLSTFEFTFRQRSRQGDIRWVECRSAPRRLANGATVWDGVLMDVTERQQAEHVIKKSEQAARNFQNDLKILYEVAFELSRADSLDALCRRSIELGIVKLRIDRLGLFLIDEASNLLIGTFGTDLHGQVRDEREYRLPLQDSHWIKRVNDTPSRVVLWDDVLLYDYDQVVGQGWNAVAALWDSRRVIGYLVLDNMIQHLPPRPYEIELLSLYGSTIGHFITLKRAEEALRQSETRQRALLNALPDLMFRVDREGTYLDYHATNPHELALRPEEFLGKRIREILPPELAERDMQKIEYVLQTGQPFQYKYSVEVGGEILRFEGRIVAGGPDEVVVIARNITELEQAEARANELILERERVHLLQKFIQDMSHDFRTPFSILQTSTYLAERLADQLLEKTQGFSAGHEEIQANGSSLTSFNHTVEQLRVQIATIDHSIRRLWKLVERLLEMEEADQDTWPELAPYHLDVLVEEVSSGYLAAAAVKNITLQFENRRKNIQVKIAIEAFKLVIRNLLDNALYYTPRGGTIRMRTDIMQNHAVLEVSDTGIGIAEADLPHIFKRFYRADKARSSSTGGIGLGLSIVQRIVEAHKGRIEAKSRIGQGSTFQVFLPLHTESDSPKGDGNIQGEPDS